MNPISLLQNFRPLPPINQATPPKLLNNPNLEEALKAIKGREDMERILSNMPKQALSPLPQDIQDQIGRPRPEIVPPPPTRPNLPIPEIQSAPKVDVPPQINREPITDGQDQEMQDLYDQTRTKHAIEAIGQDSDPYSIGAQLGSSVLKDMIERGQQKFSPEQLKAEIGKMTDDEREALGLKDYAPTEPTTMQDLLGHVDKNKLRLKEVVKGAVYENYDPEELAVAKDDISRERYDEDFNNLEDSYKEIVTELAQEKLNNERNRKEDVKFQSYQLPGGTDYEERLVTLPSLKDQFKSSHFDESPLWHERYNKRETPEGKMRFVEEIQSDWHQKGRKDGYSDSKSRVSEIKKRTEEIVTEKHDILTKETKRPISAEAERRIEELDDEYNALIRESRELSDTVPNAPFKTKWPEYAMKRAIRLAKEEGSKSLGWTTGEQQAERYDLSKQIDAIHYQKKDDGSFNIIGDKGGRSVLTEASVSPEKLETIVGKDIAKKIISGEKDSISSGGFKILKGENLKVGGEGMKGFYDTQLPIIANKLAKRWGGKVENAEIPTTKLDMPDLPNLKKFSNNKTVHSLDLVDRLNQRNKK